MKRLAFILFLAAAAIMSGDAIAIDSRVTDVRTDITRIQPPTPENCTVETIRKTLPGGGVQEFNRNICSGYFWGKSAMDYYKSNSTRVIGVGANRVEYETYYIRFPTRQNSDEPFQEILVPRNPLSIPHDGTYEPSLEELNRIFWGKKYGGLDQTIIKDVIAEVFLPQDAFAEVTPLQVSYGLIPTRRFTDEEILQAATLLREIYTRMYLAIEAGEYGECGTVQRLTVERISYYMGSFLENGLRPNMNFHDIYGRWFPIPEIYWAREPSDVQNNVEALYVPRQNAIYIREGNTHLFSSLFHELIHAGNRTTQITPDYADQMSGLIDEWMAYLGSQIIFGRHYPYQTVDYSAYISANYRIFMSNVYEWMFNVGFWNAYLFFPYLPEQFTTDLGTILLRRFVTAFIFYGYYLDTEVPRRLPFDPCLIGPNSNRAQCTARIYDWILPRCAGHGLAGRNIQGCPDPNNPGEFPDLLNDPRAGGNSWSPQRLLTKIQVFELLENKQLWAPFVHQTIAEIEANGGVQSWLARGGSFYTSCPKDEVDMAGGTLGGINAALNHDNIESAAGHPPWAPGDGLIGPPPLSASRDLPLNPSNITSDPNEPGYTDSRSSVMECILYYSEWGPSTDAACYEWCWDNMTHNFEGLCNDPQNDDVDNNCNSSRRNRECLDEENGGSDNGGAGSAGSSGSGNGISTGGGGSGESESADGCSTGWSYRRGTLLIPYDGCFPFIGEIQCCGTACEPRRGYSNHACRSEGFCGCPADGSLDELYCFKPAGDLYWNVVDENTFYLGWNTCQRGMRGTTCDCMTQGASEVICYDSGPRAGYCCDQLGVCLLRTDLFGEGY